MTAAGIAEVNNLVGRRVWFTLISHNTQDDTLVTFLKPAKVRSSSCSWLTQPSINLILCYQYVHFTLTFSSPDSSYCDCLPQIFARSVNEQLVRDGLALVGPMDLQLHKDERYTQLYMKLLKVQDYAEKKKLGMWKPSEKRKGILARLWSKIRSLSSN